MLQVIEQEKDSRLSAFVTSVAFGEAVVCEESGSCILYRSKIKIEETVLMLGQITQKEKCSLWGPPSSYPVDIGGSFPGGKVAGASS
jgi:hypothetical protein